MKLTVSQIKFLSWTFRVCLLSPLMYWFYLGQSDDLGAQPIVTLSRQTGYVVLGLILANLWLGVFLQKKWLGPQGLRWIFLERRSLGIASGFYVLLHFTSYLIKEAFEAKAFLQIFEAFYLSMGFIAMLLILLLTVTSNDFSVRKWGLKRWKKVHRLVHVASLFILAHVFSIEKGNLPLLALLILPLLPFQLVRFYGALVRKYRKI